MNTARATPELKLKVANLVVSSTPNKEIAKKLGIPYTQVMSIKRALRMYERPSASAKYHEDRKAIEDYLKKNCAPRTLAQIELAKQKRGDNTKGKVTPVMIALTKELDALGFTQLAISRGIGIDQATVSRILNGRHEYRPKRVATKPVVAPKVAKPQKVEPKPGLWARLCKFLF